MTFGARERMASATGARRNWQTSSTGYTTPSDEFDNKEE